MPSARASNDARLFAAILTSLCAYYLLWYAHFWPGVFDFDSGVYISQVVTNQLVDQKPFLYARFLQLFSLGGWSFPAAIVAQIVIASIAIARMLLLVHRAGAPAWAFAFCVLLAINPYVAMMLSYVQNDVLFSVAVATLCCEAAFVARTQRAGWASLLVFALFAPMAFFFRENGKVFVPMLWLFMALSFPAAIRRKTLLTSGACVLLAAVSAIGVDRTLRPDAVYFMVIHEVVGLARPEFQEPLGSRLSQRVRRAIGEDRLAQSVDWYSSEHWDSIGFVPGGPKLLDLERERKDRIIEAFFRRDLWRNLPAVLGHRLQLFLTAAIAGPFDTYQIPEILPEELRVVAARARKHDESRSPARSLYEFTFRHRAVLWSPLPGVVLAIGLCLGGIFRRDLVATGIGVLLCTQALLIAGFAPAAQLRYLFPLYLAPFAYWVARPVRSSPEP